MSTSLGHAEILWQTRPDLFQKLFASVLRPLIIRGRSDVSFEIPGKALILLIGQAGLENLTANERQPSRPDQTRFLRDAG